MSQQAVEQDIVPAEPAAAAPNPASQAPLRPSRRPSGGPAYSSQPGIISRQPSSVKAQMPSPSSSGKNTPMERKHATAAYRGQSPAEGSVAGDKEERHVHGDGAGGSRGGEKEASVDGIHPQQGSAAAPQMSAAAMILQQHPSSTVAAASPIEVWMDRWRNAPPSSSIAFGVPVFSPPQRPASVAPSNTSRPVLRPRPRPEGTPEGQETPSADGPQLSDQPWGFSGQTTPSSRPEPEDDAGGKRPGMTHGWAGRRGRLTSHNLDDPEFGKRIIREPHPTATDHKQLKEYYRAAGGGKYLPGAMPAVWEGLQDAGMCLRKRTGPRLTSRKGASSTRPSEPSPPPRETSRRTDAIPPILLYHRPIRHFRHRKAWLRAFGAPASLCVGQDEEEHELGERTTVDEAAMALLTLRDACEPVRKESQDDCFPLKSISKLTDQSTRSWLGDESSKDDFSPLADRSAPPSFIPAPPFSPIPSADVPPTADGLPTQGADQPPQTFFALMPGSRPPPVSLSAPVLNPCAPGFFDPATQQVAEGIFGPSFGVKTPEHERQQQPTPDDGRRQEKAARQLVRLRDEYAQRSPVELEAKLFARAMSERLMGGSPDAGRSKKKAAAAKKKGGKGGAAGMTERERRAQKKERDRRQAIAEEWRSRGLPVELGLILDFGFHAEAEDQRLRDRRVQRAMKARRKKEMELGIGPTAARRDRQAPTDKAKPDPSPDKLPSDEDNESDDPGTVQQDASELDSPLARRPYGREEADDEWRCEDHGASPFSGLGVGMGARTRGAASGNKTGMAAKATDGKKAAGGGGVKDMELEFLKHMSGSRRERGERVQLQRTGQDESPQPRRERGKRHQDMPFEAVTDSRQMPPEQALLNSTLQRHFPGLFIPVKAKTSPSQPDGRADVARPSSDAASGRPADDEQTPSSKDPDQTPVEKGKTIISTQEPFREDEQDRDQPSVEIGTAEPAEVASTAPAPAALAPSKATSSVRRPKKLYIVPPMEPIETRGRRRKEEQASAPPPVPPPAAPKSPPNPNLKLQRPPLAPRRPSPLLKAPPPPRPSTSPLIRYPPLPPLFPPLWLRGMPPFNPFRFPFISRPMNNPFGSVMGAPPEQKEQIPAVKEEQQQDHRPSRKRETSPSCGRSDSRARSRKRGGGDGDPPPRSPSRRPLRDSKGRFITFQASDVDPSQVGPQAREEAAGLLGVGSDSSPTEKQQKKRKASKARSSRGQSGKKQRVVPSAAPEAADQAGDAMSAAADPSPASVAEAVGAMDQLSQQGTSPGARGGSTPGRGKPMNQILEAIKRKEADARDRQAPGENGTTAVDNAPPSPDPFAPLPSREHEAGALPDRDTDGAGACGPVHDGSLPKPPFQVGRPAPPVLPRLPVVASGPPRAPGSPQQQHSIDTRVLLKPQFLKHPADRPSATATDQPLPEGRLVQLAAGLVVANTPPAPLRLHIRFVSRCDAHCQYGWRVDIEHQKGVRRAEFGIDHWTYGCLRGQFEQAVMHRNIAYHELGIWTIAEASTWPPEEEPESSRAAGAVRGRSSDDEPRPASKRARRSGDKDKPNASEERQQDQETAAAAGIDPTVPADGKQPQGPDSPESSGALPNPPVHPLPPPFLPISSDASGGTPYHTSPTGMVPVSTSSAALVGDDSPSPFSLIPPLSCPLNPMQPLPPLSAAPPAVGGIAVGQPSARPKTSRAKGKAAARERTRKAGKGSHPHPPPAPPTTDLFAQTGGVGLCDGAAVHEHERGHADELTIPSGGGHADTAA
ncbi:unnamed protein product [Vitrella brassicaformis CCMP3155]|uniref:Uncharacterized protein n=4 Tax=Vitrella brassicaformis TaxID=1169539 RepID=A0A0G4F8Y6_VITBC|nr:unnamed protein product [Vitrella brassicaformis CCMP3155]|eukprot:CEM08673.1 unnamed protein product [Vitrella brassicaformis CCMP3155]